MKDRIVIEYIGNTCDIDRLNGYGEILIIVKDGEPVAHHDYSDGAMELDYIPSILEPYGILVDFKCIRKPSKELVSKVVGYLIPIYGLPPDEEDF